MLNFFMGVKASLTLGREEKPWVKVLVRLKIAVEKIYLIMTSCFLSWSMGSIEAIYLVVLGDTKGFLCKKEEIFMMALKGKCKCKMMFMLVMASPL